MTFLAGIGVKIWSYMVAVGGFLLALLLFWNKAKKAGKKEVKDAVNAKTTEAVIETVKKDKEIDQEIESTPADVKRDKLRKQWGVDGYTK